MYTQEFLQIQQRNLLLRKLVSSHEELYRLLMSVAHIQDWRPTLRAWSFRELAAHLMVMDGDCFSSRIIQMSAGIKPHFDYQTSSNWNLNTLDIVVSLDLWRKSRHWILSFVKKLPVSSLSHTGVHMTAGEVDILEMLHILHQHDEKHSPRIKHMIGQYRLE